MNKRIFSWYLYDWGNSAFATVMMAAVLPIFFSDYIASDLQGSLATSYWGYANSAAMLFIAIIAPFLGAVADVRGVKKRLIGLFAALGALASVILGFVEQGQIFLMLILYILGRIAFAGGNIFYDSLLPHIVKPDKQDKVSSQGYALGYLGGGLVLSLSFLWIIAPQNWGFETATESIQFTFIFVGLWWFIFTIPLLRIVEEPPKLEGPLNEIALFKTAWQQMGKTFSELKKNKEVLKFLFAYFIYNDGIGTIMVMAAIFGHELNIPSEQLLGAILAVQFIGVPATYLFGRLAEKITTKRAIIVSLTGYVFISIGGFWVQNALHFWILAISVGLVQGGSQALSRSFYASMIPKEKSAEYFSFYDVFSKFSSILGPLVFALVAGIAGSSRMGIISLVVFFIAGIWILSNVRTKEALRYADNST